MYGQAASVLTRADIHKIRHYVQHKHGDLPTERRAEIVADAMQRIVLRQLPEFQKDEQLIVMKKLLREVVAGEGIPVSEAHIFEASMSLDVDQPDVILPLHKWTETRLGMTIDFRLFREAVNEGRRLAAEPSLGMPAWDAVIGTAGLRGEQRNEEGVELEKPLGLTGLPFSQRQRKAVVYSAMIALLCAAMLLYGWRLLHPQAVHVAQPPVVMKLPEPMPSVMKPQNALPDNLRFVEVDRTRLVQYLRAKKSLLAEEPYLGAILRAAQAHDIHPLLMFAITGQEQAFVPKTAKNAKQIANNPFNVYYSWQAFNTTIEESARIAGNTINRLSYKRPANVDAIQWINREYAQDENWSTGVNSILRTMVASIMTDK
ncbi:hypothetical protein GZH47_29595 [Paenibacillus rhizovicinus]|uniref:Uncharacterized protein n=1 Tax=Paenibacillus rhizovicinus TaxID=2704463 RepID=A0A6C0P7W0_9BACL|nr:hypothetical protein [Paenibacillus rhizovicinus]QHW34539.1 hypothetical protein GZH47_29595 [Paenibacillus rhizovicinus]